MNNAPTRRDATASYGIPTAIGILLLILFLFSNCSVRATDDGNVPSHTDSSRAHSSARQVAQESYSPDMWTPFGPFLKPAMFADTPELPGPADIVVPGHGVIRLDASELLPGEKIEREVYSFTYDEGVPVVAGIVQVHIDAEGENTEQLMTSVIGVDVTTATAAGPMLISRTNVFKGPEHTMAVGATSDLGVVAVLLSGRLLPEGGEMQRLIGVDVVRGTEVWFKEGGSPIFGRAEAFWQPEPQGSPPGDCPGTVQGFAVASGRILWEEASSAGTALRESGKDCPEFSQVLNGYALITHTSGNVGIVDTRSGAPVVKDHPGTIRLDPKAPFALMIPEPGVGAVPVVKDLRTGAEMYRVDAAGGSADDLSVKSLFAGDLYLTLGGKNLIIDARTGENVGTWSRYPVADLGDHAWMDDGSLTAASLTG